MIYRISHPNNKINTTINLTTSKSESNRVLIIQALTSTPFTIHNIAKAKDTQTLHELLQLSKNGEGVKVLDVGPAGTTMRFLTAYLAITPGEYILTGSKRMKERPIGILVDALRQLGADISYEENEGFPPLRIKGKTLTGSEVRINGSVSSQYITALLLIAPVLPQGLSLILEGEIASVPYIQMTLKIMEYFGVKSNWTENVIRVEKQEYKAKDYTIEADWSAASYWFEIAALAEEAEIIITGLLQKSLQGDSAVAEISKHFGIETEFGSNSIRLIKHPSSTIPPFNYDFSNCPDIAQTLAVIAAGSGVKAELSGLASLKIKETDRILALINELGKCHIQAKESTLNILSVEKGSPGSPSTPIKTYEDHRMAMAFAPLALSVGKIDIEEPGVVEKSYPAFWEDLKKAGFIIEEVSS